MIENTSSKKQKPKNEQRSRWLFLLFALLLSAALCAAAGFNLMRDADRSLSDMLYQRPGALDGEVVIIGMDQKAVERFGPMPWNRSILAETVECLNADPENAPAAIGLDVLYVGSSGDTFADDALVQAAASGGNVVTAAAATFGTDLAENENGVFLDTRAVLAWDMPFDALAAETETGHINAMADTDGYIRHALLRVNTEGGTYPLFARVLYEKYCACNGLPVNPLPVTTEDFYYIPFSAKPGSYYDGISIVDILDGTVDASEFAGKVVLIGPYTAGMQDEYRTAVDHAQPMYGIEIQANLVDAFRTGFYPREAHDGWQLAVLAALSFGLLLFLRKRKVGISLLAWVLVAGGWVALCVLLRNTGWLLHVLWVPAAATVIFITSVLWNYISAAREKRQITATFGRYVDPAILKELLKQGDAAESLGGKLYDVAVLFVDIRGFTTMSEALQPTEVVDILNRYLSLTTDCVMRNHGTLDKFVGDCTMAFWNAPLPQDDAIYLACRAAMDMVEGSKALGEELLEKFGRTVSFGVGVHYGSAVIGNIGASKRMDYTAIGDTVNTAARLEANAPGGTVLISRVVADALGDRAKVTSLGDSIKLKGKAEGFETLTLDSLQ